MAAVEADAWCGGYGARFADHGLFAVTRRGDDEFLGILFLGSFSNGAVQLGYRFRHVAWGFGYATEAARAGVQHGFTALTLPRIVAFTRQDNHASAGVLRKIGMEDRGVWIIFGYHARVFAKVQP